jgi:ribosome recycling factor
MTDPRIAHFQQESQKVLQFLIAEFSKLQTGRANPALVEHISVEAYGQRQELRTVAGVSIQDARTIVVQPWDRSILADIERAISQSPIGSSPVNDGTVLRISLPPMTEERRASLCKLVQKLAEEARISVRQIRQTVLDGIKEEKDEDVKKTLQGILQKEVDGANGKIDDTRKKKEEEVMKI